jgi:hypothetical protein
VPTSTLDANFTPEYQLQPWVPTSTLGANFTPGCQLHPWVPTSPLGANFNHEGQRSPLGSRLKTGLRLSIQESNMSCFVQGIASLFIIIVIAVLFMISYLFPTGQKNQNYYLLKDWLTW